MGTRGYHSYRGRSGHRRVILAVVLVLLLLFSLAFLALQDFLVYDSQGNVTLDLPFLRREDQQGAANPGGTEQTGEGDSDLNLIIEAPQAPAQRSLRAQTADPYDFRSASPQPQTGFNALVVTLKGETGVLYYQSNYAAEGAKDSQALARETLSARLGEERDWTAVAALNCFHDTYYAFANMAGAGICQSSGYIWYDNTNTHWLDPSKEGTRTHLYGLAQECVDMGFEELLLRGLAYPTQGKQYKIDYSDLPVSKEEALENFLIGLREALGEGTAISIELDETLILEGSDATSGQDISRLIPLVDRVYVETENADAVWAALSPYVPEERTRDSFLVVVGSEVPVEGSCCQITP